MGRALSMLFMTAMGACASAAPAAQAAQAASLPLECRAPHTQTSVVVTRLANVPALVRIPTVTTLPPILLWHGFGPPASEQALMAALPLDDVPAIKVYLGLPLFGARMPTRGMAELAERQAEDLGQRVFAPVVMGAADELASVVDALADADCLDRARGVGLFGFSAGGASTLLALADRKVTIRAAVTLNASTGLAASVAAFEQASGRTYTWTPAARELANRSDAVLRAKDIAAGDVPPALLIIHGSRDPVLGPRFAIELHEALRPRFEQATAGPRLRLLLLPGLAHTWTDTPQADEVATAVSQWFRQHL